MKWIFTSDAVLEETNTHFCIQLLSGTWTEPLAVKIKAPKIMPHNDREKYLRQGLAHAKEFMNKRHKFTARYLGPANTNQRVPAGIYFFLSQGIKSSV